MILTQKQLKHLIKEELQRVLREASMFSDDFTPGDLRGGEELYKKKLRWLPKHKDMMEYYDELYQYNPDDWHLDLEQDKIIYMGDFEGLVIQKSGYMDKLRVATIQSHPEFNSTLEELNKVYKDCLSREKHPATKPIRTAHKSRYPMIKKEWGIKKICALGAAEVVVGAWLLKIKEERLVEWTEDNTPERARIAFKTSSPRRKAEAEAVVQRRAEEEARRKAQERRRAEEAERREEEERIRNYNYRARRRKE